MAILINELDRYGILPTAVVESGLSDHACRLYWYMATRPKTKADGTPYQFYEAPLRSKMQIKDSRTFRKYMQELLDSGWVTTEGQDRQPDGTMGPKQYTVKAEPAIAAVADVQKMQPLCNSCRTAKNAQLNKEGLNKLSTTTARTSEQEFFEVMMQSEGFMDALAMQLHLDKESLRKKAEEFKLFITGCTEHWNQNDYNQHFRNWLMRRQENGTTASREQVRRADADRRREECAAAIRAELEGAGKVEDPTDILE